MQGTIYRRVKHHCNGTPRWVRLPNPTPKTVTCPACGRNLTTEKEVRYDASWWGGGKKRGKSFSRKHDAQRHLAKAIQEVHDGSWQPARARSMNGVFDQWLEHIDSKLHKSLLKRSTHLSYRGTLEQHLRPAFGSYRSDQLTAQVVQAWERRAAENSKPKTHNNRLGTLRVALVWAREQRYIRHDPMQGIRPARVPKVEQPCLEPEGLKRLLDAAATLNQRDQTIIYLAAYSGLRRGELFGLQWRDLDESTHQLHVRRSLFRGVTGEPKTAHSKRPMDLPAPIVTRLLAYREQCPPIGDDGFLFRTSAGHPLNANSWTTRVLVPTYMRAGLNAARPFHSLRHGYASMLINAGENPKYVSEQLGHASIGITMDLYAHLFRQTGVTAMERLSALVYEPHTPVGTPDPAATSGNQQEPVGMTHDQGKL